MLPGDKWIEIVNTLRDAGYSEPQIAEFNRLSMLEFIQIRAEKIKMHVKSADNSSPIVEGGEDNEKD